MLSSLKYFKNTLCNAAIMYEKPPFWNILFSNTSDLQGNNILGNQVRSSSQKLFCAQITRFLCTDHTVSVHRSHGFCAQITWFLCTNHTVSVHRSHGFCAQITRFLCTDHTVSVHRSHGFCAQITRFLCTDHTVSAVAMQQCVSIYAHRMHFTSFYYYNESSSTERLTPNFQCTQSVLNRNEWSSRCGPHRISVLAKLKQWVLCSVIIQEEINRFSLNLVNVTRLYPTQRTRLKHTNNNRNLCFVDRASYYNPCK